MDEKQNSLSVKDAGGSFLARNRLPNELWCDIWQHLHLCDRVSIAQVCRNWRDLALQTPNLWTRLDFYTTRHHFNCLCEDCFRDIPQHSRHESGWVNSPYPENLSNESLIHGVLDRSGDLALHLHLDIVPYSCDTYTASGFALPLVHHSHRIAGISAVAPNSHTVSYILSYFTRLPALRVYSLAIAPGCEDMWRFSAGYFNYSFVSQPIDLPQLAVLDMRNMGVLEWPEDLNPSLHFPAVRFLGLHTVYMRDVVLALRTCPAVFSLHVELSVMPHIPHSAHGVSSQELHDALASVQNCRVDGMEQASEDGVLDGFSSGSRTSLVLQYLELPARGFGILRDAASSAISIALKDNGLVSVTAEGARKRQIIFPADNNTADQDDFWRMWDAVPLVDGVRRVASDDAIWTDFVQMRNLSSPRVERD